MNLSKLLHKICDKFKRKPVSQSCINCKHCRILRDIHTKRPYAARCDAIDSKQILFSLEAAIGSNNACVCYEFKEPSYK